MKCVQTNNAPKVKDEDLLREMYQMMRTMQRRGKGSRDLPSPLNRGEVLALYQVPEGRLEETMEEARKHFGKEMISAPIEVEQKTFLQIQGSNAAHDSFSTFMELFHGLQETGQRRTKKLH